MPPRSRNQPNAMPSSTAMTRLVPSPNRPNSKSGAMAIYLHARRSNGRRGIRAGERRRDEQPAANAQRRAAR
jgi:hypothetical protein